MLAGHRKPCCQDLHEQGAAATGGTIQPQTPPCPPAIDADLGYRRQPWRLKRSKTKDAFYMDDYYGNVLWATPAVPAL